MYKLELTGDEMGMLLICADRYVKLLEEHDDEWVEEVNLPPYRALLNKLQKAQDKKDAPWPLDDDEYEAWLISGKSSSD